MNRIVPVLLMLLALISVPALGADWYVSTAGTAGGTGTQEDPWDLQTAFDSPAGVAAGDTIWIYGGTYTGAFTPRLNGTDVAPIVVRPVAGETVVLESGINVNLEVAGSYIHFRDLEIAGNGTDRISTAGAPWPQGDTEFGYGFVADGPGNAVGSKLINCVIRDRGVGVALNALADNFEIAGCLIYFNGYLGGTNPACFNIQNESKFPTMDHRVTRNNIVFGGYNINMQCYGGNGRSLSGMEIADNTFFECGVLTPSTRNEEMILAVNEAIQDLALNGNVIYRRSTEGSIAARLSIHDLYRYNGVGHISASIQNNYVVNASLRIYHWNNLTVRNNTLIGPRLLVDPLRTNVNPPPAYDWDVNTYYCSETVSWGTWQPFRREVEIDRDPNTPLDLSVLVNWTDWRSQTGYDANSTYSTTLPTDPIVVVKPDPYDLDRGHINVINLGEDASASADVSSVLTSGQSYSVIDAQNYHGAPIATGTYTGTPITIPMTNTVCEQPRGHDPNDPSMIPTLWVHTAPKFGAFILIGSAAPSNTAPVVSAGADQTISLPATGSLDGTVTDDGNPNPPGALTYTWSMVSGPAAPIFAAAGAVDTTATFLTSGTYVLRLTASDSAMSASDDVQFIVNKDLRADFNNDQFVDGLDFLRWQANFNQWPGGGATKTNGDATGDGIVDGLDFLVWQAGFNR